MDCKYCKAEAMQVQPLPLLSGVDGMTNSGAGLPAVGNSPAVASSAFMNSAYSLGPGDAIAIEIFNVPEYSGQQQVLADGSLNLPVVGRVNVNGLTLQEAGSVISAAYASELRYPARDGGTRVASTNASCDRW